MISTSPLRRWSASPVRLKKGPNTDALYALENPAIESTVAALALLRQFLLGRDDALKCATAAYLRHSGDDRRIEWIKAEIASFEAFLTGSPWQFGIESHAVVKDLTNRQLIETFIYGSGFFHRQSNKNLEDRLSELVAAVPREQLVFCFHGACRQLLRPAFVVAPVIYQDFAHWTNSGWCCRPTRVVVTRLFADSAPAASAVTP